MAKTTAIPVVFVVSRLGVGGAETQVIQLADSLDRRFSPVIVCIKDEGEQAECARAAGIRVVSLNLTRGRDPRVLTRLVGVLREVRPSIVHCTNLLSTVWGRAAAVVVRVPCIVTAEHSTRHSRGRRLSGIAIPVANRIFASSTDRVVACGYNQVPVLVAEGNRSDRILVVFNGVDADRYDTAHDPIMRRELGIPDDALAVGIIARLSPEKNHAMLVRAASILSTQLCEVHFVIVGDGPYRPQLERLVADAGLGQDVTFLGERRDVPRVLTALDVVVLTSTTESFPLSVLEGMAAGRPVVATDVGDVSRIMVDGETGYVVPSEDVAAFCDRLGRLAADPALRAEMGLKGRQRVAEMYPRTLMTHSYEQMFDEILREKGFIGSGVSSDG
jgi:glycosyltransferase involved in cell wall biosynthesis